jgi:hypothetical protein
MGKCDPLLQHLCRADDEPLQMSFDEIGQLVGPLPESASRYQAWWSNDSGGRHVQAQAWLEAGREVLSVDRPGRRLTFSAPATTRRS